MNISTSRLNYNGVGMVLLNYYQNMYDSSIILDYLSPDVVVMVFKYKISQKGNSLYEFGYKAKKMRHV